MEPHTMEYDDEDLPIKPKRVTRQPHEMRDTILFLRVTRLEYDRLYRYARARKATMSYMVRSALEEKFPDIFADTNRHIRKPRKPVEMELPPKETAPPERIVPAELIVKAPVGLIVTPLAVIVLLTFAAPVIVALKDPPV